MTMRLIEILRDSGNGFNGSRSSTISALENGTRRGTTAVWKRLAAVLEVPMEMLIPQ